MQIFSLCQSSNTNAQAGTLLKNSVSVVQMLQKHVSALIVVNALHDEQYLQEVPFKRRCSSVQNTVSHRPAIAIPLPTSRPLRSGLAINLSNVKGFTHAASWSRRTWSLCASGGE